MKLTIDTELITPQVMTLLAWLKDALSQPGVDVREYVVDGEHFITAAKKVYRIIVARSYYQAQQYIKNKGYNEYECSVTLCNFDGEYQVPPTMDAVVIEEIF